MTIIDKQASKLRLAFLGDSITVGDGDTQARGWPSRLCQSSSPMPTKMQCYNLGVGGDLITDLARRIEPELNSRLANKEGRGVVIMIGINDALRAAAESNKTPLELETIKAGIAHIMTQAKGYAAVLAVEPAPVLPEFEHRDGIKGAVVLQHLAQINKLLVSVCNALDIPFLSLTNNLLSDSAYIKALHDGDGLHPHDIGYDRIASHISASTQWGQFLTIAKNDV